MSWISDYRDFRNIRKAVKANNGMAGMDFFSYIGSSCSDGFTIDLKKCSGLNDAYEKCSPVSTVIGRVAVALANGRWWIADKEDNDVSEKYPNLKRLLVQPNPMQSWTELFIQADTYRSLYGEVIFNGVKSIGFKDNKDIDALWVVKPNLVQIETSNKTYFQSSLNDIIKGYYIEDGQRKTELDKDSILHIRDTYQNVNFGESDFRGRSRLLGLEYEIRNIIQAQEAIYALNKDRGAQGILSNEKKDSVGSIAMTPEEKEDLQKNIYRQYGMGEFQNKVVITDSSVKWQSMSYNVRDLMLYEGMKSNIEHIADAFGYPFVLLANSNGSTFNNVDAAEKSMYQNTIIPIAKIYSENLTKFFGLDEGDRIYADFSHIECMQESNKENAETMSKRIVGLTRAYQDRIITREEYRTAIDMDETPTGTTYYEERSEKNRTGEGEEV